jgi:aryl-alcohol dehydrogenase
VRITAAVVRKARGPFELEELELADPRPEEVVVRVAATGICHTDLSFRDQRWPFPLPAVLGHEGAGVVEHAGSAVGDFCEGDRVLMGAASCGGCASCLRGAPASCRSAALLNMMGSRPDGTNALHDGGETIHGHFVGQSSFATHAIAGARSLVKVPDTVPLEILGPLACSVQTGAGAVLNVLRPAAGSSIAVLGVGSVGLSAVMAASVSGCARIIVVDLHRSRLELAKELGATDVVDASAGCVKESILDLTGGGADYAVEASGAPSVLRTAFESIHTSGVCALVGAAPPGTEYAIESTSLLSGRTLRGVTLGAAVPKLFVPTLIDLHARGRFPFEKMIRFYDLAAINEAANDAESGTVVKPVVRMSGTR